MRRTGRSRYAGLGELWFESRAQAAAALASPEWGAVGEDALTFMDPAAVTAAWAEDHVVF